jgi:hypothetical protein
MCTSVGIRRCAECGDRVPEYYAVGSVCYGCHLDTYVPVWYAWKEAYRWDPTWNHPNATRRPLLGVAFLDESAGKMKKQPLMLSRAPQLWGQLG